MIIKKLTPYIEKNLAAGYTVSEIGNECAKEGYNQQDIIDTLQAVLEKTLNAETTPPAKEDQTIKQEAQPKTINKRKILLYAALGIIAAIAALIIIYFSMNGAEEEIMPELCSMESKLSCFDALATKDEVAVSFGNFLGFDIKDVKLTAEKCGSSKIIESMGNGAVETFRILCKKKLKGEVYQGDLQIEYTSAESGQKIAEKGSLVQRIAAMQ